MFYRIVVMKSSLYGFSNTVWKRGICFAGIRVFKLDFLLLRFRVQCYSARRARALRLPKANPDPSMEEDSDAFYVVRKGNMVGIYKSLSDCQAQVSSSVCDPSVSVYKGYSLRKETEAYLASRGFKNALYTIDASDIKEDLFGTIVPCPFQQPDGLAFAVDKGSKRTSSRKRLKEIADGLMSCILEFDGASKGNPGKAGAGVILRAEDGSVICRLRQGLGVVTNNVAEYRALILGLEFALKKGYKKIIVHGDSQLVCMQVQGIWQTKNQNMSDLCKVARELKDMFSSFEISHVKREFNSDADAQANLAIDLRSGEVYEEHGQQ